MPYVHENMQGAKYYWEYIKRFGKESFETWWKDFVIALLLAVIPVLLAWGDRTVLQGAVLALEATVILFGFVALRHFVHTSLILFRERAHPELAGIRFTHWVYGILGPCDTCRAYGRRDIRRDLWVVSPTTASYSSNTPPDGADNSRHTADKFSKAEWGFCRQTKNFAATQ